MVVYIMTSCNSVGILRTEKYIDYYMNALILILCIFTV